MNGKLRYLLRFPASILLLALLLISMYANRQYTKQIRELCSAGRIVFQEGSIAWEGLDGLAPGNLERDEQKWRWARERFEVRCRDPVD